MNLRSKQEKARASSYAKSAASRIGALTAGESRLARGACICSFRLRGPGEILVSG